MTATTNPSKLSTDEVRDLSNAGDQFQTLLLKYSRPVKITGELCDATPAEIDSNLFPLVSALHIQLDRARSYRKAAARWRDPTSEDAKSYFYLGERQAASCEREAVRLDALTEEASTEASKIRAKIAPLDHEYDRRGGWSRYWLVVSSGNGHVHTDFDCSTCFDTTLYSPVHACAGLNQADMIDLAGAAACSACYPEAPSSPSWERSLTEAKARRAATQCAGTGSYPEQRVRSGCWATCLTCGEKVGTTPTGKIRKHESPEQRAAKAEAKRLAANTKAGRCQESGRDVANERHLAQAVREAEMTARRHHLDDWSKIEAAGKVARRRACPCGKTVTLSSTGKIPAHKAPKS